MPALTVRTGLFNRIKLLTLNQKLNFFVVIKRNMMYVAYPIARQKVFGNVRGLTDCLLHARTIALIVPKSICIWKCWHNFYMAFRTVIQYEEIVIMSKSHVVLIPFFMFIE